MGCSWHKVKPIDVHELLEPSAWRPLSYQTLKPRLFAGCVTEQSLPTALKARLQHH
jgi:hypothetical protein